MPEGDPGPSDTTRGTDSVNKAADGASRLPPLSQAPPLAVSSDDLRALVLDYLSHSCFVDSALAFVKEWEQSDEEPTSSTLFLPYAAVAGSSGSDTAGPAGQVGHSSSAAAASSSRPPVEEEEYHDAEDEEAVDRDDDDDDEDDAMMQSVHGTFDGHAPGTNGHGESYPEIGWRDRPILIADCYPRQAKQPTIRAPNTSVRKKLNRYELEKASPNVAVCF